MSDPINPMKLYKCSGCQCEFPATEEFWFNSSIIMAQKKPLTTSLGKCKPCGRKYSRTYSQGLKDKKLSRSRRPKSEASVIGKLYIVGVSEKHPFKIGISTGTTITKRVIALQTGHWMDLKVFYESPVVLDPRKLENTLHKLYKNNHVRGEWFKLTTKDIEIIKSYVESPLDSTVLTV